MSERTLGTVRPVMVPYTVGEACASCRFWRQLDSRSGECRRHAPAQDPTAEPGSAERFGRFPLTLSVVWCGDYLRKG